MKTFFSTFCFFIITSIVYTQNHEFEVYNNGLIYNESTINQLKQIVDSLNLKFKACEITESYYSKPQTQVLIIQIEEGNIKQAAEDLENKISLEDLKQKYPSAVISEPRLLIAYPHIDYEDNEVTRMSVMTISDDYGETLDFDKNIEHLSNLNKGSWIIDYIEGSEYSTEHITAFYLLNPFKREKLKDVYAEMIQYADCMIDTTSTKFLDKAEFGNYRDLPENYSKLSLRKKKKLLEKLRSTKVIGGCSMDSSPRYHAINIAMLSAETINWEVFLKAHLDVMNDRFDRVSDGSYAWKGRKTYLNELEVLDINTLDLLLGIALRIDNAHKNHYYGSIGRLGRALSESKNKSSFEKQIIAMIKDEELDDYNRYLMYYLYDNYLYNLNDHEDESIRALNFDKVVYQLKEIQQFLPAHLVDNN